MLAYGKSLGVGAIAVLGLIPLCLRSAPANTYTWDASGNGSAFDGGGNWDTFSVNWWNGGTGADQAWNNSTNDTAVFGTGAPAANSYTVTLDAGSITAAGVIFQNQSYTLANSTLNLGPGGIKCLALTGGTTTIASSVYLTDGAQTWSVGNGAALAITGGVSRAVGATVNFNPAASGAFLTTALTNDSTGIVGPWATYGTGASAQYATVTGGAIGGLSQAPVSSLSGNNGSTNYTFSGSSVAGSTYVNTVTYTGPSASISVGLYNFGFNGFLAAGSAPTVTIGSSSNYITLGNYGGTGANSTGEMIIGGPQNVTMPGIVYNEALVYNGQGVLSLTNASNSYSGGTYITSGAVAISSNANLGYGNLTLDGGALNTQLDCGTSGVTDNSWLVYNLAGNQTASYPIGGSGSLYKAGNGILTLASFSNSYGGGTTIAGGVIAISSSAALGSGTLTFDGGALNAQLSGNTFSNAILVAASGGTINDSGNGSGQDVFSGPITGSGPLTILAGANDGLYTNFTNGNLTGAGGRVNLVSGYLFFQSSGGVNGNSSAAYTVNSADCILDYQYQNASSTFYMGSLSGAGNLTSGEYGSGMTVTLSVGALGSNTTYSGALQNDNGTLVLTKVGSGSLTLTGGNTYGGNTTVSAGTLNVAGNGYLYGSGSFTAPSITVAGGAALIVNSTDPYLNPLGIGGGSGAWNVAGLLSIGSATAQTLPSSVTLTAGTLAGPATGNSSYGAFYSGTVTIDVTGDSFIAGGLDTVNIAGGNTLTLVPTAGTDSLAVSGQIVGGGTLAISGEGTVILSGTNSFTGGTEVESGTLVLEDSEALAGGSSLTVGQGASSIFAPAAGASPAAAGAGPAVAAVPEPATLALVASGLCIAAICRRFRTRRA